MFTGVLPTIQKKVNIKEKESRTSFLSNMLPKSSNFQLFENNVKRRNSAYPGCNLPEIDCLKDMIKGMVFSNITNDEQNKDNMISQDSNTDSGESKFDGNDIKFEEVNLEDIEISIEFKLASMNQDDAQTELITIFKNNLNLKSISKISTILDANLPPSPQPISRINTGLKINIGELNSEKWSESADSNSLDKDESSPMPNSFLNVKIEEKVAKLTDNFQSTEDLQNCTEFGKLLVLFACNLMACNQIIDALKVIETYGFKYNSDQLSLSNMHLLLSLIFLRDGNIESSFKEANQAITLFRKCKSASGLALCYLLESFLSLKDPEESSDFSNTEQDEFEDKMPKQEIRLKAMLRERMSIQQIASIATNLNKELISGITQPILSSEKDSDISNVFQASKNQAKLLQPSSFAKYSRSYSQRKPRPSIAKRLKVCKEESNSSSSSGSKKNINCNNSSFISISKIKPVDRKPRNYMIQNKVKNLQENQTQPADKQRPSLFSAKNAESKRSKFIANSSFQKSVEISSPKRQNRNVSKSRVPSVDSLSMKKSHSKILSQPTKCKRAHSKDDHRRKTLDTSLSGCALNNDKIIIDSK